MSLRVSSQDNFVRPQKRSHPPKRKVGLDQWPQGDARRRLLDRGERLRARNEHLAMSQGWIRERYKVGEIVNRRPFRFRQAD